MVEAADTARASLERDLHDGAQQYLVALRYALGLAGARAARQSEPALAARLADADLAAERALADLRELAHGISAATLAVEGLAGAVRSAAERAPGAVTIVELPTERLPERVEQGVYGSSPTPCGRLQEHRRLICLLLSGVLAGTSSSSSGTTAP